MTGVGGDTGRGLRVAARSFRTWLRLGVKVVMVVIAAGLGAAIHETYEKTAEYDRYIVGVQVVSEIMLALQFDPDGDRTVLRPDDTEYVGSLEEIATFEPYLRQRARVVDRAVDAAILGGGIGAGLALAALFGLHLLGRRLGRGRRLRGGELVSQRKLARRTLPWWRCLLLLGRGPGSWPYTIARTPWPKGAETRHTIVSGTTGSGKTVLIADLVEQIRQRGERCIVYDKMGSYTETFFDEHRDVLLNPLDRRAPRWSPFLEARTVRDFDTMAAALIPRQKDAADPFWITAARQLFSHGAAVLWQRGVTRNRVLVDHLLKTELSALAEAMEGTVAQSIVDPANPKTALSVRAMLTANIGAMDLLPDEGDPFSIREWIEHDGGGFLFLTSRGDQHASLRGLISTWLEIAVNALLSLPRQDGQGNAPVRRTWVILDELPTLHQLPSLRPGLAESRQFGGCFVLGVQVFSALRDLYGRDGAETISGLCGTRVVLAAPDKDTSEWSAESLGRVEVEALSEGVSYETPRDGVTLSTRRDLRPLVLPSEVSRLENLSGYLKFPGAWPVAHIRINYRKRTEVAERFVPKAESEHGGGSSNATEERAAMRTATAADGEAGDGASCAPAARQSDAPSLLRESVQAAAAPAGRCIETDAAEAPMPPGAVKAMSDEAEVPDGTGVLEAVEWVREGSALIEAGIDAPNEPSWLFEEPAASAGTQGGVRESSGREHLTGVQDDGAGKEAMKQGMRAADAEVGERDSSGAAPSLAEDRRQSIATGPAGSDLDVRRPLWL